MFHMHSPSCRRLGPCNQLNSGHCDVNLSVVLRNCRFHSDPEHRVDPKFRNSENECILDMFYLRPTHKSIVCGDYPIHVVGHLSSMTLEFGMICQMCFCNRIKRSRSSQLVHKTWFPWSGPSDHGHHVARNINEEISTGRIHHGIKCTCRNKLCGLQCTAPCV